MDTSVTVSSQGPLRPEPCDNNVGVVLAAFQQSTGCQVHCERGLRRSCFPIKDGLAQKGPSERGREVFIGRLPRDLLEDELYRMTLPYGEVVEIRLMLMYDCPSMNRGYAFVVFSRKEEAKTAIEKLDKSEIRPGRRIGVKRSVDNCRLFMGGSFLKLALLIITTIEQKSSICLNSSLLLI